MICRALAALALGGALIILPGTFQTLDALQTPTDSVDLIDSYQRALSADQDNLTLHYLLGVALLQDGQNAAALAELQTAYPAYQQSIEAQYNLAIASLRLNDLDSAEIYLDQAIDLGASNFPGLYPVADLYFNMALKSSEAGNTNEAIRYFHKTLALDPERYEVFRQLGDLYAQRGDTELAISSFHAYLDQFPDDEVSRDYLFALEFNRAQDFLAAEDLDNAAKGFSAALKLQPESPTALYYQGYIAYEQQRPEEAVALLQKAFTGADAALQQTIRPLLYNTALTLRSEGKPYAAIDAIDLLANSAEAQFSELFLAGTLSLDIGSYRAAQEYLSRAVAIDPTHQGAQQNLIVAEAGAYSEWLATAEIRLAEDNLEKAESALKEAETLQPNNQRSVPVRIEINQLRHKKASVSFADAQAALDKGDLQTAANEVEAGLALQPGNPDGLALRDKINLALTANIEQIMDDAEQALAKEQWAKAQTAYEQVLAISPRHAGALDGLARLQQAKTKQVATLLQQGQKHLDAGQAGQAAAAFTQLLEIEPDNLSAREGLTESNQMIANRLDEFLFNGRQALGRNQFAEAHRWFEQALAISPSPVVKRELENLNKKITERADYFAAQAVAAGEQRHYRQARKLFKQALKLVPDHAPSITGQKELAEKVAEAVKSKLTQGQAALQQNDYTAATSAFRDVLDIQPGNREALAGLEQSRENQADKLDELVSLGQQALEAGKLNEAEQFLSAALQQDAYHAGAQKLRQRLEQVRQSGAKPGDEQELYLQGVSYYTQGKYTEAIRAWETVLLLDAENKKAMQNIEKTRRKLHQLEEYRGG